MNEQNRRTKLLLASIALAKRAESSCWMAKLQHHEHKAKQFFNRSCLQQKAAFRLQRWAGVGA